MKFKKSKLTKLENNRFSVFYKLDHCCYCGDNRQITLHEIYAGKNRQNSMKYGFVLPLCLRCHQMIQNDATYNNMWYKEAQSYFEKHIGTRDDFIRIFRKNYK